VRPDGTVKVLDFGLAKAIDPAGASSANATNSPTLSIHATQAGIILGTAAYMSPEQARGKAVDKRTDIWAFGAVVFEMLAGRRAFAGVDASETIASVLAREPDWSQLPAGLSATLQQYLKRCLDKDQKRRVRDIGDLLLAIDGAFDPPTSTVASAAPPLPLWRRAMPIPAAALIAAAATGLVLWPRHPEVAPAAVSRFEVVLPPSQEMRNAQRSSIAVARDGRAFAYRAMDGIHLRSIDDVARRLIPGTTEGARSVGSPFTAPFFSPDGQWIGYFEDAGLKKIGIAGGSPVTIVASSASAVSYGPMSFGASWSANNTILFGQPAGMPGCLRRS
jgi:serine/threonine-protein kinase